MHTTVDCTLVALLSTVHSGNNNVCNPFFVLIHDKCRDFRAHLNSCQLPCHSYLLLYNYHLSSLQGHRHEEDRQDCSLTWFYGKERSGNGADALCTQYHNSVLLYSGLFVFGQFEFLCHFWWVKKQKKIKTTCLLTHYFLQSQPY